jgi:hypothetical protein
LKSGLYAAGRALAVLVAFVAIGLPVLAYGGESGAQEQPPALFGTIYLAWMAGVIAHEFGHLLACRALGAQVTAIRIGGNRALIRFRAGTVQVSLGWPNQGRVTYTGAYSVWRRAVITLAGGLVDLLLAGLVLAGSAVASRHGTPPLALSAADGLALGGFLSLLPYRSRSGRPTDGARLLELRSGIAAAKLQAARLTVSQLLNTGRTVELLELHAGLDVPGGRLTEAQAAQLVSFEYSVALLPGRLPDDAVRLIERRVSPLAQRQDLEPAAVIACLTLALLRLRQGDAHGQEEAERLCERVLARKDLTDGVRHTALAAVIMSRQARGLPYADVRAMTAARTATGEDIPEVRAAVLSAAFDPEAALRAFRRGDPGVRLGAGDIAMLLRRQGRIGELLELHTGFGMPAGPHARVLARSLHSVEYNVLLMPDQAPGVIDEAASRVQWIVASYPHDQRKEPVHHAAFEHTLALARLRQGRFGEVEPLCASALAADVGQENRATVLATIALARRALGQPHADVLAEAVALSPDADLVAEAQPIQPARESQPFGTR